MRGVRGQQEQACEVREEVPGVRVQEVRRQGPAQQPDHVRRVLLRLPPRLHRQEPGLAGGSTFLHFPSFLAPFPLLVSRPGWAMMTSGSARSARTMTTSWAGAARWRGRSWRRGRRRAGPGTGGRASPAPAGTRPAPRWPPTTSGPSPAWRSA